ncbi:phytanoyl-CoA dioxygenase family protein [Caballeronia sp. LZ062]|uniref:phytanoyl-CoA dioxygenase family protein n=1 Tax=unclassified Caballeronia TaxID=2646786 RepID=UPI00286609CC|nr:MULTISPECIES: phytanoyl-CoA dioxygenase family protein [unclassified Caballeronia]MDR5854148.1 phytanoyl-CoA dioxygenase family protein [Caballeronia sp. LZ050]MDR5871321.1 phytanoyl-CoA dioxygenase family protein [Caballeronia sp. LZ062]
MDPWVFSGLKPDDVASHLDELSECYAEHGLVVMPGLLAGNEDFVRYLDAIRFMFGQIFARYGERIAQGEDIGDILVRLKRIAPLDGRIVADMGTQPNKFAAGNRIKFADFVTRLLEKIFGNDAVIATPQAGDTLHLFMPGEEFHRYNLPIHQDYQYLMQSPRQATLYLGLSRPYGDAGGLEYWPGSHKLGVLPCERNENGAFRVMNGDELMKQFRHERYLWEVGDVSLFDSLMCHRSIPNTSADRGRSVQIFRFSDLNNVVGEKYDWRSTIYERRGARFEAEHAELFKE